MKLSIPPEPRRQMAVALEAAGRPDLVRYLSPPRKPPAKKLPEPKRKVVRAAKRAEHRETTRALRVRVLARSEGWCELSGVTNQPLEMHHLEMGSGVRRQRQTFENTLMVSREAHRLLHANDPVALEQLRQWAKRWGYELPKRYR